MRGTKYIPRILFFCCCCRKQHLIHKTLLPIYQLQVLEIRNQHRSVLNNLLVHRILATHIQMMDDTGISRLKRSINMNNETV